MGLGTFSAKKKKKKDLVSCSSHRKCTVGCKWVHSFIQMGLLNVSKTYYFPRIIPRPMYGIDYDETFSVVAKIYLYAY